MANPYGGNRRHLEYSAEFKGQVLAEYAAGASIFALSKKHGVTDTTIRKWALETGVQSGQYITTHEAAQEVGALVFKYMRKNLQALMKIADQVIQDEEWRKAQSAEGLALIATTIHDHTIHMLSSMQANHQAQQAMLGGPLDDDDDPEYIEAESIEHQPADQTP